MFVVGDEKQSIYSFQGARPELLIQEFEFHITFFISDFQLIGITSLDILFAGQFDGFAHRFGIQKGTFEKAVGLVFCLHSVFLRHFFRVGLAHKRRDGPTHCTIKGLHLGFALQAHFHAEHIRTFGLYHHGNFQSSALNHQFASHFNAFDGFQFIQAAACLGVFGNDFIQRKVRLCGSS
ncbi:MAG TPA: UvrD-helicase domain-containing protein [Acidobacteriota bacterium]|nr:UvrD-helicase domain-containing protein [Acidobacteriota bacterium]